MSSIIRSSLLLGVAVLSLAACSSSKGPGAIGSADDIVVRNNGLPQAKQAEAAPAPATTQTGDFSSTVEQAEAHPAPEVTAAEPLPDTSPAMEQAVQAQADATAPVPSTVSASAGQPPVPATTENKPIDAMAPMEPVTDATVTPPAAAPTGDVPVASISARPEAAPAATGGVYPATDYAPAPSAGPAATPVPAPDVNAPPVAAAAPAPAIPAAAPLPQGVKYPLDPNAPYSPKAVAAAVEAAGGSVSSGAIATPVPTPPAAPTGNVSDPATIKAAQTALKAKGAYTGAETGVVDAAFLNALIMYQAQNNLPQGGLNEATLRALGVIQ